jgi:GNAT superfamily N-acetyltransferase
VTLFYISEYSQQEIGAFLEIPVSTVKMRLHHARKRLKERMIIMIQDNLYRQRPSRNETFQQDLQAMLELVQRRPATRMDDYPSIVDLHELSGVPETQANARLWERADGKLAGFAIIDPKYQTLDFDLTSYRDDAVIVAEMVAWATELFLAAGLNTIHINCRDDHAERKEVLAQLGFSAEPVRTLHLRRPLTGEILEPQLPAGFAIRPVDGEHEVEQLVELHRAAFGTENMTVAYRLAMMRVSEYDPQLDLVAVAPDGRLAAFCFGYISQAENRLSGRQVGRLDPVGTRPEFRRRGLARALLLTGLQLLKQRGMESVATGMSKENIAMRRTAEAVRFAVDATTVWFSKGI